MLDVEVLQETESSGPALEAVMVTRKAMRLRISKSQPSNKSDMSDNQSSLEPQESSAVRTNPCPCS